MGAFLVLQTAETRTRTDVSVGAVHDTKYDVVQSIFPSNISHCISVVVVYMEVLYVVVYATNYLSASWNNAIDVTLPVDIRRDFTSQTNTKYC